MEELYCVLALVLGVPIVLLLMCIAYANEARREKRRAEKLARGVWTWGRVEFKKRQISHVALQQLQQFLSDNYASCFDQVPLEIPEVSDQKTADEEGDLPTAKQISLPENEVAIPAPESSAIWGDLESNPANSPHKSTAHAQGRVGSAEDSQGGIHSQRQQDATSASPPTMGSTHPLDRPNDPPEPQVVRKPRKPLRVALRAFMSEKNIHWGELLSGILIVGSALGLILSLRSQFEQAIPYFSSLMFLLLTAAMHGAGHYTLRRWKLQTTSRGVLLIASLLLPLNLLLGCLLENQGGEIRSLTDPIYWTAILLGSGCITGLAYAAGRCLVPRSPWSWPIALVGTSLPLLWINRWNPEIWFEWHTLFMVLPPIAAYFWSLILASLGRSGVHAESDDVRGRAMASLLRVAGVGLFSILGTLVFYLWRSPHDWVAVKWLGPGLALLAVALLYLGRVLNQRRKEGQAFYVLIASNARIIFGILLVTSLILGWPDFARFAIAGAILTVGILLVAWFQGERSDLAIGLGVGVAIVNCLVTHGAELLGFLPESSALTLENTWVSWPASVIYGLSGLALLFGNTRSYLSSKLPRRSWKTDSSVSPGRDEILYLGGGLLALAGAVVCKLAFWPGSTFEHLFGMTALSALAIGVGSFSFRTKRLDGILLWFGMAMLAGAALLVRVLPDFQVEHSEPFWGVGLVGLAISGVTAMFGLGALRQATGNWKTGVLVLRPLHLTRLIFVINATIAAMALLPLLRCGSTGIQVNHAMVSWLVVAIWFANGLSSRMVTLFGLARLASYAAIVLTAIAVWTTPEQRVVSGEAQSIVVCEAALGVWLMLLGLLRWKFNSTPWSRWSRKTFGLDNFVYSFLLLLVVIQSLMQMQLGWLDNQALVKYSTAHDWFGASPLGWFLLLGVLTTFALFKHFVLGQEERNLVTIWYAGTTIAWSAWLSQWDILGIDVGLRFSLWAAGLMVVASMVPETEKIRNRLRHLVGTHLRQVSQFSPWFIGALLAAALGGIEVVMQTYETSTEWAKLNAGTPNQTMFVALLSLVGPWLLVSLGASLTFYQKAGPSALKLALFCGHAGASSLAALLLSGNWLTGSALSIQLLVHAFWGWGHLAALYGSVWLLNRGGRSLEPIENPRLSAYEIGLTLVSGLIGVLNLLLVFTHWTQQTDFLSVHGMQWIGWGIATLSMCLFWKRKWASGLGVPLSLITAGMVAGSMLTFEFSDNSILLMLSVWMVSVLGVTLVRERWKRLNLNRSSEEMTQWRVIKLAIFGLGGFASVEACVDPAVDPSWRIGLGFAWIILAVWLELDYQDLCQRLVTLAVVPATLAMVLWQAPLQLLANVRGNELVILGFLILLLSTLVPRLETLLSVPLRPSWGQMPFRPMDFLMLGVAALLSTAATLVAAATLVDPPVEQNLWLILEYPGWACLAVGVVLAGVEVASRNLRHLALALWLPGLHTIWVLATVVSGQSAELTRAISLLSYSIFLFGISVFLFRSRSWLSLVKRFRWTKVEVTMNLWRVILRVRFAFWASMIFVGLIFWHFQSDSRLMKLALSGSWVFSVSGLFLLLPITRFWRYAVLVACYIAGLSVLWSDLGAWAWEPDQVVRLTRFILSAVLATLSCVVILPRWFKTPEWMESFRTSAVASALGVMLGMALLLPIEMVLFDPINGLPFPLGQSFMVLVLLIAFSTCAMMVAVVPDRFGWMLSDLKRQGLVYFSEVFLGLTCLQAYLAFPHLFQGVFRDYWPFLLLFASMVGASVGHWIRGRGAEAIGLPILRTATWAPLIPVFVLWWFPSRVDYSLATALIGLIYLIFLAPIHKNWNYGWITAICFNLALLSVWGRIDILSFELHPQLWLIPPAVTILAALQIRRRDLPNSAVTLGRYLCMAVIYISSTWEIFESGIGDSLWPPMILALLSLGGAFLGIAFQIRGFVYFGTLFLFMSVLTMVAHAHRSLDHTWPWWVFGIVSGISILTLFGLLERQSEKTRQWWQQWRRWDS